MGCSGWWQGVSRFRRGMGWAFGSWAILFLFRRFVWWWTLGISSFLCFVEAPGLVGLGELWAMQEHRACPLHMVGRPVRMRRAEKSIKDSSVVLLIIGLN